MPNNNNNKISVSIRNRDRLMFEGEAISLTTVNATGTFDILAQHANFITIINGPIHMVQEDTKKVEVKLSRGILRVKDNTVTVLVEE